MDIVDSELSGARNDYRAEIMETTWALYSEMRLGCRRSGTDLVEYMKGHERRKVLFGSNHPFWPATDCLQGLDDLGLGDETRKAFLHDNAVTAFGL